MATESNRNKEDPIEPSLSGVNSEEAEFLNAALGFYRTVKTLRGPNGCPWDKEQTVSSLRRFMIEECYEAVEAASQMEIDPSHARDFCDELGDVLLQVFLNSQVASDDGVFSVKDVFVSIDEKMIRRHPHVFAKDAKPLGTAGEVVSQWTDIKKMERQSEKPAKNSLLAKAEKKRSSPTLNYACEVSKRAKRVGFAWPTLEGVLGDLDSEIAELKSELLVSSPDWAKVVDEMGDIVYALANVANHLRETVPECEELDLDLIARAGIEKFVNRFHEMEQIQREKGQALTEDLAKSLDLETWNELWKLAKKRRYR